MRRALLLSAAGCVLLAALTKFLLVGYGMTALCFLGLAAILAFYGLLYRRKSRTAVFLRVLASVLLIAGFSLLIVTEIPIVRDARGDTNADADYLIVAGAAVHGVTPSLSMRERTDAALVWLNEHPDGIAIVSGGQGKGEDITEAQAMFDLLTAQGISPERILMESESSSSYENLLFSLRLLRESGGDMTARIAVCSSEYHLHRLSYIAEELGFTPVLVPAETRHISLRVNYFLREAAAMWKYHLLGAA